MKFSIRDLFLVTMIAALAVGWWVDHRRVMAAKERSAVQYKERIERLEAQVAEKRFSEEDEMHIRAHLIPEADNLPIPSAPAPGDY